MLRCRVGLGGLPLARTRLEGAQVLEVQHVPVLGEVLATEVERRKGKEEEGRGEKRGSRTASVLGHSSSKFWPAPPNAALAASKSDASCSRCRRNFSASGSRGPDSSAAAAELDAAAPLPDAALPPALRAAPDFCARRGRSRASE